MYQFMNLPEPDATDVAIIFTANNVTNNSVDNDVFVNRLFKVS